MRMLIVLCGLTALACVSWGATESQSEQFVNYTVVAGDTTGRIAHWFRDDLVQLVTRNQLAKPELIYPGQQLLVKPYLITATALVSWYGEAYQGKPMANGRPFNMYDPSIVAHKRLPFGTRVRLRDPDTGRSIEVVVQDRGPYFKERDFDLSYAAAKLLGLLGPGVKRYGIEILALPKEI